MRCITLILKHIFGNNEKKASCRLRTEGQNLLGAKGKTNGQKLLLKYKIKQSW